MSNLARVLNEDLQEDFIIDSDSKAEWALKIIAQKQSESDRYINTCLEQIEAYKAKIEAERKRLNGKTGFLESMLQQYFQTVEKKSSKTQMTYRLPSGTLKLKKQAPEFKQDKDTLLEYLKANKASYVKITEDVDWAELKKTLTVHGEFCVDADGEVIPGITVEQREAKFIIETE